MPSRDDNDDLVIRDYEDGDDAACKQLEVTASQFQVLGALFKAAIVHHDRFDSKARQFSQHVLLVCVSGGKGNGSGNGGGNGNVCGVIAVALKRARVHGAERLCGFVFDLRVDEAYQRRGIGGRLARAAEARCAERGVGYLYLSVNNSNRGAQELYRRLGWNPASRRALLMRPLLLAQQRPAAADAAAAAAGGGVRRLAPKDALELVASHYAERDLGLDRAEV